MMFLNWTRVAILYEDEYGLIRLQELVRAPPTKNVEIYIRQTGPANYRSTSVHNMSFTTKMSLGRC